MLLHSLIMPVRNSPRKWLRLMLSVNVVLAFRFIQLIPRTRNMLEMESQNYHYFLQRLDKHGHLPLPLWKINHLNFSSLLLSGRLARELQHLKDVKLSMPLVNLSCQVHETNTLKGKLSPVKVMSLLIK